MRLPRLLLFLLLTSFFLYGTIHEDAEDRKTSRWKLLDADSSMSINNIKDSNSKSRVIHFDGEGTKQGYELKINQTNQNESWLSWQMKFSEDFVIIVLVETNIGEYYLVYTPGVFKGYMHYGLGYAANNGEWQTIRRNLQEDIAYFDNRVKQTSFKSFVLKGNGSIDNILTEKKKLVKVGQAELVEKNIFEEEVDFSPMVSKATRKTVSSLPVITIEGSKFVTLSLGEPYIEEGVSAYDKEDGVINVESIENINPHVAGRYMVLYMAIDHHGNMAVDKRFVHMGEVDMTKLNKEEPKEEKEESEAGVEERNEQIKIWEKALELKEKELAQREKKSNKN
ncbi:MAG TPA: DUF5011 domain-containing protein [Campylobacterales bacterium]|nr:DUF5011 domain-containing protein [Campylobacterales bacterium]